MAEVKAQLRNLRMAPRKVRAVSNLIKRKNVTEALNQLEYFVRKPVRPVKKLLESAIANAENNFNMVKENLYVKELFVDEGRKLKRFRAKGFGRAEMIEKKTSHIIITLGERVAGLKGEKKASRKKEIERNEDMKSEDKMHDVKKPEIKREMGSKGNALGNLGKKLFQRKAV